MTGLTRFLSLGIVLAAPFQAAATPIRIALNWKAEPEFGGFYQGDVSNLFQKANLDVTILEGGSGTPTIQMVQAGQVDYAVVSGDQLALSYEHGAKNLVAIFAVYQVNPHAIMVHAEKNYADLGQLVGDPAATLLWAEGLPYSVYIKKKYASNWKIKTAPYAGGIGLFQKDPHVAQQCFATSEPLLATKVGVATKTFLVSDEGFNPYTTVVVTRRERLKKNLDEVKKFALALRESWKNYLRDPAAANAKMAKLNPSMDAATFAAAAAAQVPFIETAETKKNGLGTMILNRWQTLLDQMKEMGQLKTLPRATELFINF